MAYFYRATEQTAKAFFTSLVKQLLAVLIVAGVPCPPAVREEIEHEFRWESRQPELRELVTNVVIPLVAMFRDVVVILDGSDLCDQKEQREIWKYLCKIIESGGRETRVRLAIASRDHPHITNHIPNTIRLRMDDELVANDIDTFIDKEISARSGSGQLFNDKLLAEEVQRLLKDNANGMYEFHVEISHCPLLTPYRFLWVSLALEVVLNRCRTRGQVRDAISKLPADPEKLLAYLDAHLHHTTGRSNIADAMPESSQYGSEYLPNQVQTPGIDPSRTAKDSGYESYLSGHESHDLKRPQESAEVMTLSSLVDFGQQKTMTGMHAFAYDVVQSLDPDLPDTIGSPEGCLSHLQRALRIFSYSLERQVNAKESRDQQRTARFIRQQHR